MGFTYILINVDVALEKVLMVTFQSNTSLNVNQMNNCLFGKECVYILW